MPLHSNKRDVGRICSSHNSSHTHGQTLQYDLTKCRVQAKENNKRGALPLRHQIIDRSLFSRSSKIDTDLLCGIYAHPAEAHVKSFPASVQFPCPQAFAGLSSDTPLDSAMQLGRSPQLKSSAAQGKPRHITLALLTLAIPPGPNFSSSTPGGSLSVPWPRAVYRAEAVYYKGHTKVAAPAVANPGGYRGCL